MPKGQPKDAQSRAQEIQDQIKALRDKKLAILNDDAAKEKLKKERKAKLLGFTLLDDEHLTPQEMATISRILARRPDPKPKHWELLADWMPEHVAKPTQPAKPEHQVIDFKAAAGK